ncbi:MAG: hypothetical protein AAF290_15415 [Pseudomonadota bacterium]
MTSRFQSYLSRLFRQPMVDYFQTPARRRAVAASVIIWQALVVYLLTLIPKDIVWPTLAAGVVMVYLLGMLNMATRGIFELSDEHLDEFQVALRDGAYRRSYYFALIWLLLVAPLVGFLEGQDDLKILILAFILLGFFWAMSAPRVWVAWTTPADDLED